MYHGFLKVSNRQRCFHSSVGVVVTHGNCLFDHRISFLVSEVQLLSKFLFKEYLQNITTYVYPLPQLVEGVSQDTATRVTDFDCAMNKIDNFKSMEMSELAADVRQNTNSNYYQLAAHARVSHNYRQMRHPKTLHRNLTPKLVPPCRRLAS